MADAFVFLCISANVLTASDGAPGNWPQVEIAGTHRRSVTSAVTGQNYDLYVNPPRSYWGNSGKTYPVLYLVNAQYDFSTVSGSYGGQYYEGFVPEIIIVGITWAVEYPEVASMRQRDFTPTAIRELYDTTLSRDKTAE